MWEREGGSQEEEGRAAAPGHAPACLCSPPSAPPGMARRQLPGLAGGGLSSLPPEPSGLWGLLTSSGLAPLPSVLCRWQLKISSARRRYLVIFSLTASHLSLLGSTVGRRSQEDPASHGRSGGLGSHCPCSAPHRRARPISEAGQWILAPHLFLGPLLGGRPAGEEDEGWWQESLGAGEAPRTTAPYSWRPPPPGHHHSLGRDGMEISCLFFQEEREVPQRAHFLLSLMPSMKEARTALGLEGKGVHGTGMKPAVERHHQCRDWKRELGPDSYPPGWPSRPSGVSNWPQGQPLLQLGNACLCPEQASPLTFRPLPVFSACPFSLPLQALQLDSILQCSD